MNWFRALVALASGVEDFTLKTNPLLGGVAIVKRQLLFLSMTKCAVLNFLKILIVIVLKSKFRFFQKYKNTCSVMRRTLSSPKVIPSLV